MNKTHHFSVEPDDEYMRRIYGCTKAEYKELRKAKNLSSASVASDSPLQSKYDGPAEMEDA